MKIKRMKKASLFRVSNGFLPAALFAAVCVGRNIPAHDLFLSIYLVRFLGLSTACALPPAYALQPSMRYVQGSTLIALAMQLIGAAIALPIIHVLKLFEHIYLLIACGLLLNIEHVFYEYLYAVGDGSSALLCRSITAVLVFTGLALSSPPGVISGYEAMWPMITCGLSAAVGLVISIGIGGRINPKFNLQLFKSIPVAMLQACLYPAIGVSILLFSGLKTATWLPLYVGLILYELCRTPFRRSPSEARPLNRALLIVCAAAVLGLLPFALGKTLSADISLSGDIPYALCALILAALCSFGLYGNIER